MFLIGLLCYFREFNLNALMKSFYFKIVISVHHIISLLGGRDGRLQPHIWDTINDIIIVELLLQPV